MSDVAPAEGERVLAHDGRNDRTGVGRRVGGRRFVKQDELVTFGPDDEVADLGRFKFDDDIESVRFIDPLKIFGRVDYNSAPGCAAARSRQPAQGATPPGAEALEHSRPGSPRPPSEKASRKF